MITRPVTAPAQRFYLGIVGAAVQEVWADGGPRHLVTKAGLVRLQVAPQRHSDHRRAKGDAVPHIRCPRFAPDHRLPAGVLVRRGAVVDVVDDHARREEDDRIALDVRGFGAEAVAPGVVQRLRVPDLAVVADGDPVSVPIAVADPDSAVRAVGNSLGTGMSAVGRRRWRCDRRRAPVPTAPARLTGPHRRSVRESSSDTWSWSSPSRRPVGPEDPARRVPPGLAGPAAIPAGHRASRPRNSVLEGRGRRWVRRR